MQRSQHSHWKRRNYANGIMNLLYSLRMSSSEDSRNFFFAYATLKNKFLVSSAVNLYEAPDPLWHFLGRVFIILSVAEILFLSWTHYCPMSPFYTLPETSENLRFSDVFRGYEKGTLGNDGLRKNYLFRLSNTIFWKKLLSLINTRWINFFFWASLNESFC